MTVATTNNKSGPYAGAGSAGPFTVDFRFLENSHLQVVKTSTAGVDSTLVLNTDYTVAGAGAANGSVTLTVALAIGEKLTILRNVPDTQEADYVNNDAFPAESHEQALDKLTMLSQQNRETLERALKLPVSLEGVSPQVPVPVAGRGLKWNADGTALENTDSDIDVAAASAAGSAGAAASSAASAAAIYDAFDDRYLGAKTTDPAVDNDGNALIEGALYWNSATKGMRVYNGTVWQELASSAFHVETFSGDGATTAFTLAISPVSKNNTDVFISGVYQQKSEYALSNKTITFTAAPAAGTDNIEIVYPEFLPVATVDADNVQHNGASLTSSTGAAMVGYIASGTGAVQTTQSAVNARVEHVFNYMSAAQRADVIAGTLTLDVSAAVQAAIDAVCPLQGAATSAGTVVADPRYPMRIDTTLNCTNSRTAGTKVRDGLELVGFNLVGNTGAGAAVMETTGSQWLRGDIRITTSGASTPSTVGVLQALSSTLTQTQNQHLRLRIFMHDDATANGGIGTVGVWNFGAEENTYDNCYVQANVPAFLTSYKVSPNVTATIPSSYQTLDTSHSTGVNTWTGESFLVALNRRMPSLITEDVNSLVFENVYMANIGTGGGNIDAWWQYGAFQGGSIQGTIEQHTGIRVTGVMIGAKLRFTFGGLVSSTAERIILTRGGQGQIVDSDIDLQDTTYPNRPLITATPSAANEQVSCYLRNVHIRCNADKQYLHMPENLLWNPSTGNVTIEGLRDTSKPYRYFIDSNRKQIVNIPLTTVWVSGGASGAEIVRFIVPTISGVANAVGAVVKITGLATIVGSTTSAMSARYIESSVIILVDADGSIHPASATNITGSQNDVNSAGNSITALSISTITGATYVQIAMSPTVSGANLESVQFVGQAELTWSGNESRAPHLEIAPF